MSEIAVLSGVAIIVVLLGFIVILPLATEIVFLQQDWDSYWFWTNLVMNISRVLYVILALTAFIAPFWNGEITLWIDGISFILLGLFGVPILLTALHALIFTSLSGLELQRAILNYAIIEFWAVATASSYHSSINKRKEKTKN